MEATTPSQPPRRLETNDPHNKLRYGHEFTKGVAEGWRLCRPRLAESGLVEQQFQALVPKKAMVELVKLSDDAGPEGKRFPSGALVSRKRQTIRRVDGNFRTDYRVRAAQAAGVSPANF